MTAIDLSDVRAELRDVARAVIAQRCPTSLVRQLADDPAGCSQALWQTFADLGWLGLEVAEEHGGAGMGFAELAVVLDELGRGVVPSPFLATVVLGAAAITAAGSEEQRQRWLPGVASGTTRLTVALGDPGRSATGVTLSNTSGWLRLDGTCRFVPDAHFADAVIVEADRAGAACLLLLDADRVAVTPTPTYDQTRRLCDVRFDGVEVEPADLVGPPEQAPALHRWLLDRAAVALAVDSHGGARRAMELSVEHAKQRVQFGRPIGSFQAVKHHCADMLVAVETARVAAETAVRELPPPGGPRSPWTSIAKSHAADAYAEVAGLGIAVHGGIGFTWEHDMHLHLKRAKLNQALYGTSAWHRDELVRLVAEGGAAHRG